MLERLTNFSGEVPHMAPRLLPQSGAQETYNVRLDDGILTPFNVPRFATRLASGGPFQTIYKISDAEGWLAFAEAGVSVARGPVANERLYITGRSDGTPRLRVNGVEMPLALPSPADVPTAVVTGTPDQANIQEIVYAYTWVTDYDEESAPSPLTARLQWSDGLSVTVSGFDAPPAGRAVSRMRLYRSQSQSTGDTGLYFIAERAVSTLDWVDAALELAEVCPSIYYDPAPDGLAGIITLPNGNMAAFIAGTNVLCWAEPWIPSAWPESYQLTTDYPIVGLAAFGTTLVVLTTGKPYIVQGTAPENMQMERLDVNQPCVSAQSIVDLGYGVAYASPDGIVLVSAAGVQVETAKLLTKQQWSGINPAGMIASVYSGRYIACFSYADPDGRARTGTFVFDFTGQQPFLYRSDAADALFYEMDSGVLYMLRNGADIYEYDPPGGDPAELYWRSKQFIFPTPLNFGCILIETAMDLNAPAADTGLAAQQAANQAMIDAYAGEGDVGGAEMALVAFGGSLIAELSADNAYTQVVVYGDGKVIATVTVTDRVVRLPARSLYQWMEIEVRSTVPVTAVSLASQPSELAGA